MVSLLVCFGLFNSCKKVIKLERNTASSQIVIQGNIYDQPGPYVVKCNDDGGHPEANGEGLTHSVRVARPGA